MIKSLLYVSLKTTPWPGDGPEVEAIVEVGRSRNATLGVTGALISTQAHFAQILEGDPAAVDLVMASILRDLRHRQVVVLQHAMRADRWFADWSLAHAGRSSFIGQRLEAMLATDRPEAVQLDWLLTLFQTFERYS